MHRQCSIANKVTATGAAATLAEVKRKEIQRLVDEQMAHGYGRQHVFDLLVALHPGIPVKKLANAVRYTPPLDTRMHFLGAQRWLLAAIAAYALLAFAVPALRGEPILGARFFVYMPYATLFLARDVYRWHGGAFPWVAFANAWSLLALWADLKDGIVEDTWKAAEHALSVLIGALAWYLAIKVYPRYIEEPTLPGAPPKVHFAPEPGVLFK